MTSIRTAAAARPQPHFAMPTRAQLLETYRSLITDRERNRGLTPLKRAPANAEKFPKYDLNSNGARGAKRVVYDIGGELYLKRTLIAPNAKPQWFNAGPAPLF